MRGRMGYAYMQCAGRPMAPALRVLSERAESRSRDVAVDPKLRLALAELSWFFVNARPRLVDFRCNEAPAILYTDGAFESGVATCGAVLFSSRLDTPQFFGFTVPEQLVSEWHCLGSRHCVAQAELLPAFVAKVTWQKEPTCAKVLHFIDNDSVKEALSRGNTGSLASIELLSKTIRQEVSNLSCTWYCRVPSASNLSDGPSRLDFTFVLSQGFARAKFELHEVLMRKTLNNTEG